MRSAVRRYLPSLLTVLLMALPAWAQGPAPAAKAPSNVPYFILKSEIRGSLEDLSMYVMSYTITHDRGIPGRIKECMKALDRDFMDAYKVTPTEEKARLKELRALYQELKPMAEDVSEMEELYGINVSEAVAKTLKARDLMDDKIMKEALLRSSQPEVAEALPLFYATGSDLSNMLTRTLCYLREKDPLARKAAFAHHMALTESLVAYVKALNAMKIDVKLVKELNVYIVDAIRCSQDAMEDFERLEPRLILFLGRVEVMKGLLGEGNKGDREPKPRTGKE
jgi:hypothetical protein